MSKTWARVAITIICWLIAIYLIHHSFFEFHTTNDCEICPNTLYILGVATMLIIFPFVSKISAFGVSIENNNFQSNQFEVQKTKKQVDEKTKSEEVTDESIEEELASHSKDDLESIRLLKQNIGDELRHYLGKKPREVIEYPNWYIHKLFVEYLSKEPDSASLLNSLTTFLHDTVALTNEKNQISAEQIENIRGLGVQLLRDIRISELLKDDENDKK